MTSSHRATLSAAALYGVGAITAVAAVITPPDVVSQLMLLVPLWLLFEGSLLIMWLGERKQIDGEAPAEPVPVETDLTGPV